VFGREAELAQLQQLLGRGRAGVSGLAIEGVPGIGKTTLWRAAVADAPRNGFRVVATAPAEPDQALAFAGLGDLFDELPDGALSSLPEPQRQALVAALSLDNPARAPADAQALPRAALTLLRGLAVDGPLLVAIDDEQWLDAASARVLGFALCRLREEPICVLLARRPDSDGALWPQLARGFSADGMPSLCLEPLGVEAIHGLLRERLGRRLAPPLLRRIHAVSGGNPFYALAIARSLEPRNGGAAGVAELPIPRTLADTVALRLEGLDPRATDPLLVVTAASNPTVTLLQSVFSDFTLGVLDSAVETGVIEIVSDRVRFTHPLLASTHYARAPAARRRELHRLLAEVVEDEEERAHHLALGAEAPDRRVAVSIEQAAARAICRGAPEAAAQLLEEAARLTPADAVEARRSRVIAAAEQHRVAGDLARARSLLETVINEVPEGPVRARALKQQAVLRSDDFEVASRLLEEALANAADHDRLGAEIEVLWAENLANRGQHAVALEHSKAAVERAERAGDPHLLAHMLAQHGVFAFFAGRDVQHEMLTRAIELAGDDEETPSYYWPSTALGCQLFWSDQLDAARPLLERSLRRAVQRGEEDGRESILFHLAHLEWEAGNRKIAEELTAQTIEAARQIDDDQTDSYILWLEAFVAARRGDLERARARANDAVELAGRIGDNFIVSFSSAIIAAVELWSGRPDAAHDRLAPLREAFRETFIGSLTLPFWSCDIEALVALGRLGEAGQVLDELFELARHAANPNALAIAHRCRGLLLAASGEVAGAIEEMEKALEEHVRRPLPLELGRTLLEKGALQRRARRKSAAKRTLEQALATLEPLEASMWIARARDEVGRIGLRKAAAAVGLTPAQLRVAELVASGMSNREVAGTLYMSLRTVETHLTKIYRELGVRSRAQLTARLAAGDRERGSEGVQLAAERPKAPPSGRQLATVLFTDIVGSTARAAELGDQQWRELLDRHDAIVRRELERFGGAAIQFMGDGTLSTFDRPAAAIDCACRLRITMGHLGVEVRCGVHTGEIELRGKHIGGIAVHIGARVAALAGPSEILVSQTVADLVAGSGVRFEARGAHELKGVPGSWPLYAVLSASSRASRPSERELTDLEVAGRPSGR
jgi:class 3 adenylate cyclase/ATP/maltotriose-dependent transcriptional regulator MalT